MDGMSEQKPVLEYIVLQYKQQDGGISRYFENLIYASV